MSDSILIAGHIEDDSIHFTAPRFVRHPQILGESLAELMGLCEGKFGHTVGQDIIAKDDIDFLVTHGAAPSMSTGSRDSFRDDTTRIPPVGYNRNYQDEQLYGDWYNRCL